MTKEQLHTLWIGVYSILLLAGAILMATDQRLGFYLFAAGTLLAVAQSFTFAIQNKTEDVRTARLHRLYFLCSLILIVASGLMWVGNNGWVVMIILYCVLTVFLSFRGNKKP